MIKYNNQIDCGDGEDGRRGRDCQEGQGDFHKVCDKHEGLVPTTLARHFTT